MWHEKVSEVPVLTGGFCLCFNSVCVITETVRCFYRGHPVVLQNSKDSNKYIYFQSSDRNLSPVS